MAPNKKKPSVSEQNSARDFIHGLTQVKTFRNGQPYLNANLQQSDTCRRIKKEQI